MAKRTDTTETAPIAPAQRGARVLRRLVQVGKTPRAFEIEGQRVVIGRDPPKGGIPIEDSRMSREHAELVLVPEHGTFRLRDLGSKNGTFLDGRKIEAEGLAPSSVIRVGDTLLVFAECELPAVALHFVLPPPELSLARALAEYVADIAAPTGLPVLVLGPTGAGKEILSKRIHEKSKRSGPFVALNCGTLSRDLLGSELFGHTKGAFSGAHSDRAGLFASAAGGTIFLDEIAELPSDQQPAFLRVLQERKVRPVGADHTIDVDARVISATSRDLEELQRTTFRRDLFARLSGVTIQLPGLGARREEILPLLHQFLGGQAPDITPEAQECLLLYDWPRNVRELEFVAANLKLFARSLNAIDVVHLPPEIQRAGRPPPAGGGTEEQRPSKEALIEALRAHGGNVAGVARALDEHRSRVYRWLEVYGLDPAAYRERS